MSEPTKVKESAVEHSREDWHSLLIERDRLRERVAELEEALRQIAKPALGGKAQQYIAQAVLAKERP